MCKSFFMHHRCIAGFVLKKFFVSVPPNFSKRRDGVLGVQAFCFLQIFGGAYYMNSIQIEFCRYFFFTSLIFLSCGTNYLFTFALFTFSIHALLTLLIFFSLLPTQVHTAHRYKQYHTLTLSTLIINATLYIQYEILIPTIIMFLSSIGMRLVPFVAAFFHFFSSFQLSSSEQYLPCCMLCEKCCNK